MNTRKCDVRKADGTMCQAGAVEPVWVDDRSDIWACRWHWAMTQDRRVNFDWQRGRIVSVSIAGA